MDQQYSRLKTILLQLAEKPLNERELHARELLKDEPALLDRVLRMLSRDQANTSFLEFQLFSDSGQRSIRLEPSPAELLAPGDQVDIFEIEKLLGSGGMGIVYQARQAKPVERQVALKLARAHLSPAQIALFERECRTQARFVHPNLTQIYAIGQWCDNQPYAAMELVQGPSINTWCEDNRAPVKLRLQLFINACLGIAHAHEKGILHRDIKPSNLLVTELDSKPTVKVIDFGISSDLDTSDPSTNTATTHGTPEYMSPEAKTLASAGNLDTRSDVYSLGVVLSELLTSQRPVLNHSDTEATDAGVAAQSGFTRTAPLETFQALERNQQKQVADSMQTNPRSLARYLRGDLADIIGRALQHQASDRYASARTLADDIERFLSNQPVEARPPKLFYVTGKLIQRHVGMAVISLLLVVSLLSSFIVLSIEANETRAALTEASAVSNFLVETFEHASPTRMDDDEILLRDVMDRASEEIEAELADFPQAQARLLLTLGRVFGETGDYNKAIDLLTRGNEILDELPRAPRIDQVQMLSELGNALRRLQQTDQAETILLRGQSLAEPLMDDNPLLVADLANSLGNLYIVAVEYEKAGVQHRRAFEIRSRNLPEGDISIGSSANNLASVLIYSGRVNEAEPFARAALQIFTTELPPGHPWISVVRNNLSIILERQGLHEESLVMKEQALNEQIDRMGENHPDLADYYRNNSIVLRELGRREEGLAARYQAYEVLANSIGAEAPRTLRAKRDLARWLFEDGDHSQAISMYRDILATSLEIAGPDDSGSQSASVSLAAALVDTGEYQQAHDIIEPVLLALRERHGIAHRRTLNAERVYAKANSGLGQPLESADWLESILQQTLAEHGPISISVANLSECLAEVQFAAGRLDEAEQNARNATELWLNRGSNLSAARAQHILGKIHLAQSDFSAAHAQLTGALARYRQLLPSNQAKLLELQNDLDQAESGLLTAASTVP